MPVDAEAWLASRGVEREPIVPGRPDEALEVAAASLPGAREVLQLARQSAQDAPGGGPHAPGTSGDDGAAGGDPSGAADEGLTTADVRADDVAGALAFIRRSTANAPQSEGRLRSKLAERGHDEPTVDAALELARGQRLVDDDAILAALIIERRARGHADQRLRRDLRGRGFTGPQVDEALERHAATDPAAAAFAVAREQAARHRTVDPEAAVRRTVGALVRRGHGEALARKAARDAVYADREAQETAGR
jgi:regulatory protein